MGVRSRGRNADTLGHLRCLSNHRASTCSEAIHRPCLSEVIWRSSLTRTAYSRSKFTLNEFTWRVTVLFASIALLTAVWVMVVDDVLDSILQNLKPCGGDCLNVYDPAQWSAVRWLTSLLLAVLSALPLIAFHVLQFSNRACCPANTHRYDDG